MTTIETHARHLEWWQRVRTLQEAQRTPWPTRTVASQLLLEGTERPDEGPEGEYL